MELFDLLCTEAAMMLQPDTAPVSGYCNVNPNPFRRASKGGLLQRFPPPSPSCLFNVCLLFLVLFVVN